MMRKQCGDGNKMVAEQGYAGCCLTAMLSMQINPMVDGILAAAPSRTLLVEASSELGTVTPGCTRSSS